MKKQVLFLQGGGDDGYEADKDMVSRLQQELGKDYQMIYPLLKVDEAASDFGWLKQIGAELEKLGDDAVLVAHSLGASLLLKYLAEKPVSKRAAGIFLLSTPFWSSKKDWVQGLTLPPDFEKKLPKNTQMFFYQCRDDEETSFDHMAHYRDKLPEATFREIEIGGHQLNNNLHLVAKDIKNLYLWASRHLQIILGVELREQHPCTAHLWRCQEAGLMTQIALPMSHDVF